APNPDRISSPRPRPGAASPASSRSAPPPSGRHSTQSPPRAIRPAPFPSPSRAHRANSSPARSPPPAPSSPSSPRRSNPTHHHPQRRTPHRLIPPPHPHKSTDSIPQPHPPSFIVEVAHQ